MGIEGFFDPQNHAPPRENGFGELPAEFQKLLKKGRKKGV